MTKYTKEQIESLKIINPLILKIQNIKIKGSSFFKDGNKLGKRKINLIKKNSSLIEDIFRKSRRHGILLTNLNQIKTDFL